MKWFSLEGIIQEAKRVRWPKREDMLKDFLVVLTFSVFFGLVFVLSDTLVAMFLKLIGLGA
jgi:preprotein translocase SecE subunit